MSLVNPPDPAIFTGLHLQKALDAMSDAFVLLDRDWRVAYVNRRTLQINRMRLEDTLGRNHWELWPASVGTELEHRYRRAMDTGKAEHFENHYAPLDMWFEIHAYPTDLGLAIYYHDVTARKHEQQRLDAITAEVARIDRIYKAALSNTPDLIYVFDLDHRFIYANEALLAVWGRTWDNAIGRNCLELGYPDWHAAMHDREIEQVIATRSPIRGEVPFEGVHGRRMYDYIFVPVVGANNEVEAIAGTTRDITDRRQSEQALRASEERLRLAQSASHLATWDWNLETGEVFWTADSAWVYGVPPEQMAQIDRCAAAVHEADRPATMQALQNAIDHGVEYNHEFRVLWPDGSLHWLGGRGRAIYSPHGRPQRILGINWDITSRKQAEHLLRTERQRLAELFEQAPAFMAVLHGPTHIFEMVNAPYQELVGQRQVLGRSVAEAIPEAEAQGFLAILDGVYQTGRPFAAHGHAIDLARTPGQALERRYLDFVYQPMRDSDGAVTRVIALGVDVTERRQAEEALRQTEKLAAVGRLATSIAHEINNPLESVTNLLYLVENTEDSSQIRHYVHLAQQELARVSQIATQTLRFYRQSDRPSLVRIPEILQSVLALYQGRLTNAGIRVHCRFRASALIHSHEGDMRQIFNNLVGNAIDAMRETAGGLLLVRTRPVTDSRTGRSGVRVTVADTGCGMTRETQKRLYEPFYSTKGLNGTGLGLWVSAGIIEKHNASIRLRTSQNPAHRGTVFTLFIPDIGPAPTDPQAADPAAAHHAVPA